MPDLNDYYAYRRTSAGSSGNGSDGNLGCGGIIIVIVVLILVFLSMGDARLDEIIKLLGLGCLAFLVIRWVFS